MSDQIRIVSINEMHEIENEAVKEFGFAESL